MHGLLERWGEAAMTSLGWFWMAAWAFVLGYLIGSMIQVFVTRERMRRSLGRDGSRAVALATFFGFISSSCSFAAIGAARALFQKGAGLVPALAFLLASTNLVIELGILIFVFLSWQFVVGEYVGGLLLIAIMWLLVRLLVPRAWIEAAREHARAAGGAGDGGEPPDWRRLIRTREGWTQVARQYRMEWSMVWRDVTVGFTVAGVIAAFVPAAFFRTLFVGSGVDADPAWWQIGLHALIGPVAAFLTFIGSMGNIPLAAVLFGSGVSFAGIMAFIFSDLVVLPVLRITARYFGLRMALTILGVFLASLFLTAILLHAGFDLLGLLPDPQAAAAARDVEPESRFRLDYTFWFNVIALAVTATFAWLIRHPPRATRGGEGHGQHDHGPADGPDRDPDHEHGEADQEDREDHGKHGNHDHHDHRDRRGDPGRDDDAAGDDDGDEGGHDHHHHDHDHASGSGPILTTLAWIAVAWLAIGLVLRLLS